MIRDLTAQGSLGALRDFFLDEKILICFNGPTTRTLISEIGIALKEHIASSRDSMSVAMDVFSVYIEMSQNIRHYSSKCNYRELDSTATVVIGESADLRYVVAAGNVVELEDGRQLMARLSYLASLDKGALKQLYKEQLRRPRTEGATTGAGIGLIDVARKSSSPIQCNLDPLEDGRAFFTLRVTI